MPTINENTRVIDSSQLSERKPDAAQLDGENTIYLGYKWAGTRALNEPNWLIIQITQDASGLILWKYPDGNSRQAIFQFSECKTYNYELAL